jgi:hypothetical protein
MAGPAMSIRGTRHHNVVWTDQWNKAEIGREIKKRFPVILEPTNTHGGVVQINGGAIGTPNLETPTREYVITSEALTRDWTSEREYTIWVYDSFSIRKLFDEKYLRLPDAMLTLQKHFMGYL